MGELPSPNMETHLFQPVEGPSISGFEISSLGKVARSCNLSSWEVWGHPGLRSELQTSLRYRVRLCLKQQQNKTTTANPSLFFHLESEQRA